jgi:methylphosphotriester-DNA--protein-cysteine methyltransferase
VQGGSKKNMLTEQALQQKKNDERKESAHDKLYQDNKHMMNIIRSIFGQCLEEWDQSRRRDHTTATLWKAAAPPVNVAARKGSHRHEARIAATHAVEG